ncbi:hypothetical protein BS78_10G227000 [Paspalum vaginatum]|nr:hypothetical protein BS78_10G227000 [Paspalum vaginatum]
MGRAAVRAAASTAAGDDEQKTSWPEVVGWVTLNADFKISSDRPDVSTAFYMIPTPLPTDYNPKRVIIVCDSRNVVVQTPVIG